jgi:transposase
MENTRSHGRPWQSRLIPYEEEILELRRRRPPMPFDQITARLATKYGMKVHLDTVHNFVKVRLGLYRENSRKRSSGRTVGENPPAAIPQTKESEWDSLHSDTRILIPNSTKGQS